MFKNVLGVVFFGFALNSLSVSTSLAQTVNIDSLMQSKADNKLKLGRDSCISNIKPASGGLKDLARVAAERVVCGVIWGPIPISITNPSVSTSGYSYSQLIISNFPQDISIQTFLIPNCAADPINISQEREVTVSEAASISKNKTIATEKNLSISGNAEVNLGVVKFGSSTTVSGKQIITNESGSQVTVTNTKKEVLRLATVIPPYTQKRISIVVTKNNASISYYGDLLLDADLNGQVVKRFSQLIPDNKLQVEGDIYSDYVQQTTIKYIDEALNPATCQSQLTSASFAAAYGRIAVAGKKSIQSNNIVRLSDSFVPLDSISANAIQKVERVGTGIEIMTANVISTVQLRAKNLGATPCEASFLVGEKLHRITLIPNSWSEWDHVVNTNGSTIVNITPVHQCEGGVGAEVKYIR